MKFSLTKKQILTSLIGSIALVWGVAHMAPLPQRMLRHHSPIVRFQDGTPAHIFLSEDHKWRIPVIPHNVDARYIQALLAVEDQRFRWHPGVDPIALVRAFLQNIAAERVVSGGSTITMQLVRLLEPRPRKLTAKIIEILRALQLEIRFSKDEILANYLQFVPYGRNIEGIESASLAYFGHAARRLTANEAAILLAVPQRPAIRYPVARNHQRLLKARNHILQKLSNSNAYAVAENDRLARVPTKITEFPRAIPHVAHVLRAHLQPGYIDVTTPLHSSIQGTVEEILLRYRRQLQSQGIHNAAVVVVDHSKRSLAALVGGFSFWDNQHGGRIPGFSTPRSTGSTLKPLIYALAIDAGIALPERLVPDIPTDYSGYTPENFDGSYSGLVRLEDALSQSLNVPFVNLLSQLGMGKFLESLRAAGTHHLSDNPGHYGLSAAVGAMELTPLDLASIFMALGTDGTTAQLRLTQDSHLASTQKIVSPGAAWLTRRALRLRDRPDFPQRRLYSPIPSQIAWKTGTSFGFHDAWSAGSASRFTAVVWLGNLNYARSTSLVGADAAAPILFDIIEALEGSVERTWNDPPPADLRSLRVCAYSGHLATTACSHTREVLALNEAFPATPCPYHVHLDVDAESGLALTRQCRAGRRFRTEAFLVLPPLVRRWLRDRHQVTVHPPPFAPACTTQATARALTIVSPDANRTIVLVPGLTTKQQEIPLEAASPLPNNQLSWFIDGELVGQVSPDQTLWWEPSAGNHDVTVVDATGAQARQKIRIVELP